MTGNDRVHISVPATTEHLTEIREFVRATVAGLGFTEFEVNGIVLAVDEACANLILHAYGDDPTKTVDVGIDITPEQVSVAIRDTALPFDPSAATLPDMQQYISERRHGGLGILIMTRVMDEIHYTPCCGPYKENLLTLVKRRHP
jgi:serine/threonine-protein kinase RsbW